MQIRTGGKTLLESTTFMALGLGETRISVSAGAETLTFVLDFIEDKEKPLGIVWKPLDANTLRIEFTNWNHAFGTTLLEPQHVGILDGRPLYVLFFIKKAGSQNELREVTFSTYFGEEAPDGKN
jgi:hypothetical protein